MPVDKPSTVDKVELELWYARYGRVCQHGRDGARKLPLIDYRRTTP